MRKPVFVLLVLLPLLANIHGCSDSRHHKNELYTTAQVRFLHGSPDAPDLDVFVNDDLEWADVGYLEGSGYHNIPPGEGNLKVNVSDTTQTLVDELATVEKHTPYSLIVVGFEAHMEALLLEDDDTPPDTGNVRVRVVHGSPSQPALDVYITEPDVPLQYATPTLQDVEFKGFSPFVEMSEGEYRIRITLSGETEPIYDSGMVTLDEDSISTAVVVDAVSGVSPVSLVVLTDDEQEPVIEVADTRCMLRLIHASPDASSVDVLLDDSEVISSVQFKRPSDYKEVISGYRHLQVKEALGQNPLTLIDQIVSLESGKDYTLVLGGFEASIDFLLLEDDNTDAPLHKAKVRFIHASPDAPALDLLVDNKVKLSYVPFRGVSNYIEYWVGDYDFQVNEAGTGNVLIGGPFLPPISLEDGKVYTYMVVDELQDIDDLFVTDN
jgi:hypothetical protein